MTKADFTGNIIEEFKQKANKIERDNAYNYKYTYWVATPNGLRLDDERNHKYGSTRDGYEQWKNYEPRSWYAQHAGVVSLRKVTDRNNNRVVGYITEERQSDFSWHAEIRELADECFVKLCEELNVIDIEVFKYFIFSDLGIFKDHNNELQTKLDIMVDVYDEYHENPDYKKLIDKIKG